MAERVMDLAKPLRFFDLPAELRDAIYDLFPCRGRIIQRADDDCAYGVSYLDQPLQHLLLVNKQFKDEYSARANKGQHLHIEDNRLDALGSFDLVPEAALESVVVYELSCLHDQCDDLALHVEMLQDLARRMKNCTAIEVKLCFEATGDVCVLSGRELLEKHKGALDEIARMANIKMLELYLHARGLPKAHKWKTSRRLVARYSGAGTWMDFDASERRS